MLFHSCIRLMLNKSMHLADICVSSFWGFQFFFVFYCNSTFNPLMLWSLFWSSSVKYLWSPVIKMEFAVHYNALCWMSLSLDWIIKSSVIHLKLSERLTFVNIKMQKAKYEMRVCLQYFISCGVFHQSSQYTRTRKHELHI